MYYLHKGHLFISTLTPEKNICLLYSVLPVCFLSIFYLDEAELKLIVCQCCVKIISSKEHCMVMLNYFSSDNVRNCERSCFRIFWKKNLR